MHLLKDLCVSEVVSIADADMMLCGGQVVQEAAGGHAALKLASWLGTICGRNLLPDLAQQL